MYILTSNEKQDLTTTERKADVTKIYTKVPAISIILWQEIKKPEHHTEIMEASPSTVRHIFPDLPIPISVPFRYDVIDQYWIKTKPWTGATIDGPGLGPVGDWPRYYGVVKLQDTNTPNLKPFYVINTHFTNGCEWDSATPSDTALALRPYWTTHYDMLKTEIDAIKAADFTVFYGGDFNRKDVPSFGSAQKLAVGNGIIDKLAVIDRSVDSVLLTTDGFTTNSDHNARWAKWELSNRP